MAIQQIMDATLGRTVAVAARDVADRARIDELVRAHFGLVWRTLRRVGLSDADADDAAQHVFLTLARRLEQVAAGSERAFVLGIAVRVAADARKAQRRRRLDPEPKLEQVVHPGPDPEQALELQRACDLLDGFLEQLDHEVRAVFALYEIEGLTMREIAGALLIPTGTVASRLRRGRAQFEAAVKRYQSGEAKGAEKP